MIEGKDSAMKPKKSGKMIFGAELTRDERKALDIEIARQLKEYDKKHEDEIDALVLYILHKHFGFGIERLRRFYEVFSDEMEALYERYELKGEEPWLCTKKLEEYGVDFGLWRQERKDNNGRKH